MIFYLPTHVVKLKNYNLLDPSLRRQTFMSWFILKNKPIKSKKIFIINKVKSS